MSNSTPQDEHHDAGPRPRWPWVIGQSWEDLLFAHWPAPADELRRLVPAPLPLDTFEGQAWLGVVPFRMSGIHGRGLPPLPGLSAFAEINVRTYVTLGGKPGVFFLSLDTTSRPAVQFGRLVYHLPYHHAAMSITRDLSLSPASQGTVPPLCGEGTTKTSASPARSGEGTNPNPAPRQGSFDTFRILHDRSPSLPQDWGREGRGGRGPAPSFHTMPDRLLAAAGGEVRYASRRLGSTAKQGEFRGSYCPTGAPFHAQPGTLEDWLTARYCFYAVDGKGRIWRSDVEHQPWPLQPAVAEIETNTMTMPQGLRLSGDPLLHFSRRVDVRIWPPRRLPSRENGSGVAR